MNDGLVSIITPFYNSYNYFVDTFKSVVDQTYSNFEWIIVDDGSYNSEVKKLRALVESDHRIRLIEIGYNYGAGIARNAGLDAMCGRFVAFIDSDDMWDPDFLETMVFHVKTSSVNVIYGGYRRLYPSGNEEQFLPDKFNTVGNIVRGCDISCLATLIDTNGHPIKARFGTLKARNDLVFYHALLTSESAYPVPVVKSTYRILGESLSRNKLQMLRFQWIVNRVHAKNGMLLSVFNCFIWSLRGLLKYR